MVPNHQPAVDPNYRSLTKANGWEINVPNGGLSHGLVSKWDVFFSCEPMVSGGCFMLLARDYSFLLGRVKTCELQYTLSSLYAGWLVEIPITIHCYLQ